MNSIVLVAPSTEGKEGSLATLGRKAQVAAAEFELAVAKRLRTFIDELEDLSTQVNDAGVDAPKTLDKAIYELTEVANAFAEWADLLKAA